MMPSKANPHSQTGGNFLDQGFGQSLPGRVVEDTPKSTTPLFDQPQFAEHAGDDGVANPGDSALHVLNGHPGK